MSHIHTLPGQHDFTVSAFIVRLDTPEPKIMLHVHKKHKKYMQFGGHVELDEDPWQAIVREIKEESGYKISQLKLLQPSKKITKLRAAKLLPYPLCINSHMVGNTENHHHIDIDYVFVASEEPKLCINNDESKVTKLFTLDMLKKSKDNIMYPNVKDISIYILEEIIDYWVQIPAKKFAA